MERGLKIRIIRIEYLAMHIVRWHLLWWWSTWWALHHLIWLIWHTIWWLLEATLMHLIWRTIPIVPDTSWSHAARVTLKLILAILFKQTVSKDLQSGSNALTIVKIAEDS